MLSVERTDSADLLQITVLHVTKKSLKMKADESDDTMRVTVLKALSKSGIQVPNDAVLYKKAK